MTNTYYMLYNEHTLEIQSLNVDPGYIPEGSKLCKIKENDLMDFHSNKKQHHLFLVVVDENGFAKFKHRYLYDINQRFDERQIIENNIIQDLDYRNIFFDYINIRYSYVDKILLTFDVDNLETDYRELYIDSIKEDNDIFKIFITEYQNPVALLTSFNLNLCQLIRTKVVSIPLSFNQPISLWGVKA